MNKKIKLLLTLDGFRIFSLGLLGPIYAIYVEKIGGDVLDAGTAFALYSIVLGVFAILVGKLGDRLKNQAALLFTGYSLLTVGFFGYLFVESPLHLMFVQVILGIGGAFAAPIFDGVFSANLDKGKYDSEWANWEAVNYIVTGVAAIVGSLIVTYYGFNTLFVIMGLSSICSIALIRFLKN